MSRSRPHRTKFEPTNLLKILIVAGFLFIPILLTRSIAPVFLLTAFTDTCRYEDDIWDRKRLPTCESQSGDMMNHLERVLSSCQGALQRVENLYDVPEALAAAGREVQLGFITLRTGVGAQRDSDVTSQPFQEWKSAVDGAARTWRNIMGRELRREADLLRDVFVRLQPDLDAVARLEHTVGYALGIDDGVAKHKRLGVELKTAAYTTVEVVDRVRLAANAMTKTLQALLATQANLTQSVTKEKGQVGQDRWWEPPGLVQVSKEPNAYVPCQHWGMCRVLEPGPMKILGPIAMPADTLERAQAQLQRIERALKGVKEFLESVLSLTNYIARDTESTRDQLIFLTESSLPRAAR
ncbi:hypothetical protein PG991_010627 [Apiospora marii]|uniref:Uncharacterized protein n=1 Tax=Apiospora marii TaxID=335849 RepID=A0ABR1RC13_9PEZI